MLPRSAHLTKLNKLLEEFPLVGLVGARQIGKTTLARMLATESPDLAAFLDLEDTRDLAKLEEPFLTLGPLRGLVILDEIQRRPNLFPTLRVLADRPDSPARFLVLGSASPQLLKQSAESLAGRIAYHELTGLDLSEVGPDQLERLWVRGRFPRSFTARSEAESRLWRQEFIRNLLERDLSALGFELPPETLRRFWTMLAHYHGQTWNGAELARSFGVSEKTVARYLDLLCSTFLVRRLLPWHENIGKRQVKSPKIYISDPGLLHLLLGIQGRDDLLGHPKSGASWEGFSLDLVAARLGARTEECFSWGLHTGAELDLLVIRGSRRLGFEMKLTDAPRVTPSMRSALDVLGLERLDVCHAGSSTFMLGTRIRAVALRRILDDLDPL